MAILARATITLAQTVDISAYYRFYKLQSSTAAPPAKPTTITTLPPEGWSDTEPSYTEESTNSLYFVDLTVFSDNTFEYSNVSLSSSYEAAKQAYNKSVLALGAVSPIDTKTYTGLIGTANTAADASFYFAKIHPTNYTVNWKVRFRMTVQAPEAYNQFVDIQFGGYGSTFSSYDSYVTRTGSIGMYYVNLYRATSAGINTNHKGHAVGFGLRSSTNPTSTSYKRTIYVELLEADNCEVEMSDTAVKYASIDGTGSTNYYQLTEMNVATAGQNATNNSNTSYTQFAAAVKAGSIGVKRYTLLMKDTDNTWCSFVNQANNLTTSKTVTDHGFLVFDKVIYMSGGAEYASGANTSTCWDAYSVDLRYSTNCGTTLVSYKPVYFVGEIHDDGLFYFDQTTWWTQTEPASDDGKTYIYLGEATSTTSVFINTTNTFYQFYDGKFRKLSDIETLTALNQSVWYAECTTAAETTAKVATITPTTSNFRLNAGASVLVKFTATNSGAVGSITLNVNDTGAKNIKYIYNGSISNIPNAGYLKANQTYQFYYDGSYWVVQMIYNTNTNNYDRRQHNQWIKAAAAITKAHIIAGTDAGYKMLASDLPFDLSYPILYSNVAIASGAQGYDVYEAIPSINISTTGTVEGLAVNKIVYLKGSLSGNTFTIATTNWLTCTTPVTADGFYYIPLGMVANDATTKMYFSTSDKLYAYINGTFQRVDKGAAAIATATHQYFWYDEDGAHIGTVEGDGVSGYNSLWNSYGLLLRKNENNLAAFTDSTIQFYDGTGNADSNIVAKFGGDNTKIGKINDIHLEMDYHSLQLIDKEDNSYFYVSDLRNTQGEMTETFTGDGSTQIFFCMVRIASVSFVSINGVETSEYAFSGMGVSFTTTPADGAEIVVKYLPTETEKGRLKAYTFGIRGGGKVGAMSVAEGLNTVASGLLSHAEGSATNAQKDFSHAEGRSTTASYGAHAEGGHTNAYSDYAHAEGYYTEAAQYAHAEGNHTIARAAASHAEGFDTIASGLYSHAEGQGTLAANTASHAQGIYTIAWQKYQTALGKYNIKDTVADNFAVILGNGTSDTARSNALTIDWSGNVVAAGNVSAVNGTFTGAVTGASYSGGAISGTTGTFTGAISGASLSTTGSVSGGAISGTTGTFTSNISAVKGTFTGAISGTTVTAGAVTSYTPTWAQDQTPVRYMCKVSAGICSFWVMGAAVAHEAEDLICTLPTGARPTAQVVTPFIKMAGGVMGTIIITSAGAVSIGQITNTSNTGRIYFNCTYPVV